MGVHARICSNARSPTAAFFFFSLSIRIFERLRSRTRKAEDRTRDAGTLQIVAMTMPIWRSSAALRLLRGCRLRSGRPTMLRRGFLPGAAAKEGPGTAQQKLCKKGCPPSPVPELPVRGSERGPAHARICVYHAGTFKITFVGCLKVVTLLGFVSISCVFAPMRLVEEGLGANAVYRESLPCCLPGPADPESPPPEAPTAPISLTPLYLRLLPPYPHPPPPAQEDA